jgi:RNA methyltransferase, TrmH family
MTDFVAEFAAARRDDGLAVLEGFHALKHTLRFGADILRVVAVAPEDLEGLARDLAPDLEGMFARLAISIPIGEFRRITKNPPHTAVITIARRNKIDLDSVMTDPALKPVVYLEDRAISATLVPWFA